MIVVQGSGPAGLAFLRDPPPVWPLLAGSRAGRSGQNGVATHTQLLGGRTVYVILFYFIFHHAAMIMLRNKMV